MEDRGKEPNLVVEKLSDGGAVIQKKNGTETIIIGKMVRERPSDLATFAPPLSGQTPLIVYVEKDLPPNQKASLLTVAHMWTKNHTL